MQNIMQRIIGYLEGQLKVLEKCDNQYDEIKAETIKEILAYIKKLD